MMMTVAQTAQVEVLLSIEDLEKMPDDCLHRELIEGELIELPPPRLGHSMASRLIFRILDAFVTAHALGIVLFEAGYLVRANRRTWIQPDVSFVRSGRYDVKNPEYANGAPDLAVEVISRSETARSVHLKTSILLSSGTQEVWNVYLDTRTVEIHSTGNAIRVFNEGDEITSSLFPDWSTRVTNFFVEDETTLLSSRPQD
jgi:Uma2 family endonuclease